jgi:hypothetical protein
MCSYQVALERNKALQAELITVTVFWFVTSIYQTTWHHIPEYVHTSSHKVAHPKIFIIFIFPAINS